MRVLHVLIEDSAFVRNHAPGHGGALYFEDGPLLQVLFDDFASLDLGATLSFGLT